MASSGAGGSGSSRTATAYNAYGNMGVQLTLKDESRS